MKNLKCLLAILVAGIVGNLLDAYVQGNLLFNAYYSKIDSMKHDTLAGWFIFADFVAVAVFTCVYKKVASAFSDGAKGGACAGFYFGVLVSFPSFHYVYLTTKGYPYSLAWINTGWVIVWYMIIGAIVGAIMKPSAPTSLTSPPH